MSNADLVRSQLIVLPQYRKPIPEPPERGFEERHGMNNGVRQRNETVVGEGKDSGQHYTHKRGVDTTQIIYKLQDHINCEVSKGPGGQPNKPNNASTFMNIEGYPAQQRNLRKCTAAHALRLRTDQDGFKGLRWIVNLGKALAVANKKVIIRIGL
ncbi:hypothetical protein CPC08DRAFT_729817 [Agrocybe pediades]|nr:hypothetical protein CPC08DRAFT_729817 [Agrocybe pediades]